MPESSYYSRDPGAQVFLPPVAEPAPPPTWGAAASSAFRLDNDMLNAVDSLTRPHIPPQAGFDIVKSLKDRGLWDQRDRFTAMQSDAEVEARAAQLAQEADDERTANAAGWAGTVLRIGARVASPTLAFPLTTPARGLKGFRDVMTLALAGGLTQESMLAMNQGFQPGKFTQGVAMQTVLGGLLGSAAMALRPGELAKVADGMQHDMATVPDTGTIPPSVVPSFKEPTAAGSDVPTPEIDPGGLKPGAGNFLAGMFPVTRNIQQTDSAVMRNATGRLGSAGVRTKANVEGESNALAGTVEDRTKTWNGALFRGHRAVDDAYSKYTFGDGGPQWFRNSRAVLHGLLPNGKMPKSDFLREVGAQMFEAEPHVIPEVNDAAAAYRKHVYEPVWEEAKRVGVPGTREMEKIIGDTMYGNRRWDLAAVNRDPAGLAAIITEHVRSGLTTEFNKALEGFKVKVAQAKQRGEDMSLSYEDAMAKREQFLAKLKEPPTPELQAEIDSLNELRTKAEAESDPVKKQTLLGQAKTLKKGSKLLQDNKAVQTELRRRVNNLNHNIFAVERQHRLKLEKIDRTEANQLSTLNRAVIQGRRFLDNIDNLSDEAMNAEVSRLRDKFGAEAARYDSAEERIHRYANSGDAEVNKLLAMEDAQQARNLRMTDVTNELGVVEGLDREAARAQVQDILDEALRRVNTINGRRTLRIERMKAAVAKLDPSVIRAELEAVQKAPQQLADKLAQRFRAKGDVDPLTGASDFKDYSADIGQKAVNSIQKWDRRLPAYDMLRGERGAELARTLTVPSKQVLKYLDTDINRMSRAYVRTFAGDIELTRAFGDPQMSSVRSKMGEEYWAKVREIEASDLSRAAKEKKTATLEKKWKNMYEDLDAMSGRLRHTWGLPQDPTGMVARMASIATQLNTLRFMGGVVAQSVPDIGRIVQKHALMHTFGPAFRDMITGFKALKLSKELANIAGTANDVHTHARAVAINDLLEFNAHASRPERALEFLSHRMGVIAMFDHWTDMMKTWASLATVAHTNHSLGVVFGGVKGNLAKAEEHLASLNIYSKANPELARRIWDRMKMPGNSKEINGIAIPETDNWTKGLEGDALLQAQQEVRAYHALLVGDVDNTIITPGIERPLVMDKTTLGKMMLQFQSFGMSSTTKTVMAGLQQHDMAYFSGMMFSLALGALSYYLWAVSKGGQAYDDMLSADTGKWADEAVSRSGQRAIFDELARFTERLPVVNRLMQNLPEAARYPFMLAGIGSVSGRRNSRREGGDLVSEALGPTFDLLSTAAGAATGFDDPTQHTLHQVRTMVPLQNHFLFSRILDVVEQSSGLPLRRQH